MRYGRSLTIASRNGRLIELIRSSEFSSPDLSEKLKFSDQTIYRDVDFLKQRGYLIRPAKHPAGRAFHLFAEPTTVSNGKGTCCQ